MKNPYEDLIRPHLEGVPAGPWRAALACFRPRTRLTLSQCTDGKLVLPNGPEPGFVRLARTPWLIGVLDAISDPTIERVTLMCAAQVGKSTALLAAVAYFAGQDPSSMLLIAANEGQGRGFVKERLEPVLRMTPSLRGLTSPVTNKTATITQKTFSSGATLALAWSTSSSSLAARPVRVLLADETDRWADTTGNDGAPWPQAVARTSTFFDRKIVACSTPTRERTSLIARLFEDSDQRRFHVPCLKCGSYQALEWEALRYKRDGQVALDDAHLVCVHCSERIEQRDKPQMVSRGTWIAENPGHASAGFTISALYSPWTTWSELAAEWVRAVEARDWPARQSFTNLRLGRVWREAEVGVDVESLEKNVEDYGDVEVPDPVRVLTVGVDTQDNRLEAFVVGWGEHKESWGISYHVVIGDTSDVSPRGPWQRLDELIARAWSKRDGSGMVPSCIAIDSGGHRTGEVYAFCRDRLTRGVVAVHGVAGTGKPIAGKATLNALRAPLVPVGSESVKEAIFSRLKLGTPGPGFMHFPADGRGFDSEFFLGLTGERRTAKRGKLVWEKTRARNEPLDCASYALAALEILLSTNPGLLTPDGATPALRPRRRVLSKGISE